MNILSKIPSMQALYCDGWAAAFLFIAVELFWGLLEPLIRSFPAHPPRTSTGTPHRFLGITIKMIRGIYQLVPNSRKIPICWVVWINKNIHSPSPSTRAFIFSFRSCTIRLSCSARLGINPALIFRSCSFLACHLEIFE